MIQVNGQVIDVKELLKNGGDPRAIQDLYSALSEDDQSLVRVLFEEGTRRNLRQNKNLQNMVLYELTTMLQETEEFSEVLSQKDIKRLAREICETNREWFQGVLEIVIDGYLEEQSSEFEDNIEYYNDDSLFDELGGLAVEAREFARTSLRNKKGGDRSDDLVRERRMSRDDWFGDR
jgi:hypothetical protein